jgi:hypothetical protein
MTSEPDYETFRNGVELLEQSLEKANIDFEKEQTAAADDDDNGAYIFQFKEDITSDFYLGFVSSKQYAQFYREYDLVPDVVQQLENEQAEQILPRDDLSIELDDDMSNPTQKFATLLQAAEDERLEDELEETALEEDFKNQDRDEFVDGVWEKFHRFRSAEQALDNIDPGQTNRIHMRIEKIFKSKPFSFSIPVSENNGIRGFKLKYQIFPHDGITTQDISNAYRLVNNHGLYTERFLRFTFNITDTHEIEWHPDLSSTNMQDQESVLID